MWGDGAGGTIIIAKSIALNGFVQLREGGVEGRVAQESPQNQRKSLESQGFGRWVGGQVAPESLHNQLNSMSLYDMKRWVDGSRGTRINASSLEFINVFRFWRVG